MTSFRISGIPTPVRKNSYATSLNLPLVGPCLIATMVAVRIPALTLFHSTQLHRVPSRRTRRGLDLLFLLLVAAVAGAIIMVARQVATPYNEQVSIDLSFWSLPRYTILSASRGFMAYALSLAFTLIYGTIAAHHSRAEKLMLPGLDVLQAVPVLGFMPGLVLLMVSLFPKREIGLELACVIMIFTAQAWNMTFSFHSSLKAIPQPLREVAAVQGLSWWRTFRLLEVPAATIGLVWNSMMSMAGGWFFLTVNEAFTLGNRDYRLPGIGSYMSEAINRGNVPAMLAGIAAMIIMIVIVDRLFWRPIVIWSQRFKMEDTSAAETPHSLILSILQRSRLIGRLRSIFGRHARTQSVPRAHWRVAAALGKSAIWLIVAVIVAAGAYGTWSLAQLLLGLPLLNTSHDDWAHVVLALLASFARTTSAVLIGAAWAVPAGVLIGLSSKWSRRLQPVIQIVASFPAPMLFPLVTMLLLYLRIPFTTGCVALMLLGAQWYILFNVIAGASAIPEDLKDVAVVYQMSRFQLWSKLYLPCIFPYLLTGLITAAGGAWNATIVSEYVQLRGKTYTAFGLGSMISHATSRGNFSLLCAAVVTMAAFVVLLNRFVWQRLVRLAELRYSLAVQG